jgi:S1-C subfamily serine protease
MRRIAILGAVLAVVATGCSLQLGDGQGDPATTFSQPLATGKDQGVTAVVQHVLPAVVNVTTDLFRPDAFGNVQQGQGVGTGFVVRPDGVIVTNCHVVEGASRISVFSSDKDPKRYDARVIGGDCLHDLAVLKVDATGLPTVALGSSDGLQLGQPVVALGYALALEGGPTVTTGIVSSLDRTIQAQDPACDVCTNHVRTYSSVVQTDAAINHGNSGGPLVDLSGRVVGINTAGDETAENIGFAIAIDSVEEAISQAIDQPLAASAYLGVSSQGITSAMAFQLGLPVDSGAYVLATTSDGPAAKGGISQGDVIVSIDGHAISSESDLGDVLTQLSPGQSVPVEIVDSSGAKRTVDVTLGTRPLPVGQLP